MVASSRAPVFLDPWLKILARCGHPITRVGQCTPPFAMHSLFPAEESHRGGETHVSGMHAPKPRPRRDDKVPWTGGGRPSAWSTALDDDDDVTDRVQTTLPHYYY
ncbi:hypothetical protein MTO96_008908 [Rhipicephalus appendiculatus]